MTRCDSPPVQPASSRTARSVEPGPQAARSGRTRPRLKGRGDERGPPVRPASFRLERSGRDRTGRRPAPADDPAEDTYDPERFPGEWTNGDRPGEEERAEGAETDWLYQRRNGYAEIHDPRSPENIERRQADSLDRLERAGPFNPPAPHQPDRPENGYFTPDHDKT